jgi:hypothetical protein
MRRAVKAATRVLCVSQTTAADLPHRLGLAGLAGWGAGELATAVADRSVADRILVCGYVAEADKAALYTGAEGFTWARCAELTAASARALL